MYYHQPSSQLIPQTMRKTNGVRSNKLDKNRIFTSKRNPRRVSEAVYSSKFDSSSNPNVVLRSTHDPTNSPNAAPRATHDLRQTTTDALGIDTHDEPGMLLYHLLRLALSFWATVSLRNSSNKDETRLRSTHTIKNRETREKVNQHSI